MVAKLKTYLSQHPNVQHMCYLPVHAAMICFLFSYFEGNIPHTETQIYEKFVIATLLRHKTRGGGEHQLKSLKELCEEEKEVFGSICKLAFVMILNSQQVISKSEIQVSISSSSVLELLTVECTNRDYSSETLYTFQHLTLQEYLAAYHISEHNETYLNTFTHLAAKDKKLKNVWKFFSGLTKFNKSKVIFSTSVKERL